MKYKKTGRGREDPGNVKNCSRKKELRLGDHRGRRKASSIENSQKRRKKEPQRIDNVTMYAKKPQPHRLVKRSGRLIGTKIVKSSGTFAGGGGQGGEKNRRSGL